MKLDLELVMNLVEEKQRIRKLSEKTIYNYQAALKNFRKYLQLAGITDLRAVDEKMILGYYRYLEEYTKVKGGKRLAGGTKSLWLTCVHKVFELLIAENLIFVDPFGAIKSSVPKEKTLPKKIMTHAEVKLLFSQPNTDTYLGYRDRTVFEFLYGTGIRIGELEGLNIFDIDFTDRLVFVRGKGRKERVVPCAETALQFLKEYVDKVRPTLAFYSQERALFISEEGKRFTANAFSLMLRKYLKKSGIKKRITAHTFRHSFATHMLESGVNVRYIQEILGHEKLSTTAIYTRVTIKKLKEEVEKYHPRENELFSDEEILVPQLEYIKGGRRKTKSGEL
ncbi:MAG: tyrosine-type recombinase/integrase [Candidatus Peribacteraceae bacterium]|nr:tyrosine-type recombinase/integrase [Candidatus Peribacteraceae bacterium]